MMMMMMTMMTMMVMMMIDDDGGGGGDDDNGVDDTRRVLRTPPLSIADCGAASSQPSSQESLLKQGVRKVLRCVLPSRSSYSVVSSKL